MTTTQEQVSDLPNGGAEDPNVNDQPPKQINQEDHDRAIQDMLKFKSRAKSAEEALESLKSQVDELKRGQLKDKEDYKALYEAEVKAHNETKSRADGLKKNVSYSEKHRAVYPALKKAGLTDGAEKLITENELDKLELEVTSSGRFNVIGIDTFVDNFKSDYPFAFRSDQPTRINSGGNFNSTHANKKITPEMVVAAEGTDKYEEIFKAYIKQKKEQQ